jgi:hypothetical protein
MAIVFSATGTVGHIYNGQLMTSDINIPAGNNRYLIARVAFYYKTATATAKAGGVAMTNVLEFSGGNDKHIFFGLVAPAVGAVTITVSGSTSIFGMVASLCYVGVNQVTPTGATANGTTSGTVASTVGNLIVDGFYQGRNNAGQASLTPGAGQTQRSTAAYKDPDNNWYNIAMSEKAAVASTIMGWTTNQTYESQELLVELLPAAAGAGFIPQMGMY